MEKQTQSFDICIVCALYEEAEAVLNEFSTRCGVSFTKAFSGMDHYAYQHITIRNKQGEPLTVLVTWLSDSGPTQTGLDLKPFLHEFRPRFVAMTGICAGYRGKVKLGDLVVAQYAYHYEEGKVIRESEGPSRHLSEMRTADSTSQVIQYVRGFDGWAEPLREMKRQKLNRQLKANEDPRCVVAPMASGMAVREDDPFPWLREKYNRNTVALDMEAATFYRAFRAFPHIHTLVVKGVCDYADMSKNDAYHDYAARASAVYLLSFIQEYVTEQTMPRQDVSSSSSRAGPPGVWNVPHTRNPHFTGRDELLDRLRQQLAPMGLNDAITTRRAALTQPQAIKGLGGIGKTQIAVEYAYRSRDLGRYTHTLWVNAATEEAMITSFTAIAELLPSFSAKDELDQRKLVEAIKRWLERCEQQWLLIFDNADDLSLVRQYLPQQGNGSILLTTRTNAVGALATSIEVEKMNLTEGMSLLLRRANRFEHASDEDQNEAINVVIALDYLPLALDQAGAYIEETACSFSHYLQVYQKHSKELLAHRGFQSSDYPHSVATTWSISFQKVEQANPAAAELLRLCAFLAPDAIPEELISNGASQWSPPLQQAAAEAFALDQAIAELRKFSLVKRDPRTETLSIHRLVQAVLRDGMDESTQKQWAERAVRAVCAVLPAVAYETWSLYERYLPQGYMCARWIKQGNMILHEAVKLLDQIGSYLIERTRCAEAELFLLAALPIITQKPEWGYHATAHILDRLARSSELLGKYAQAERLYLQALSINENNLGPNHLSTATSLNNLAGVYQTQRKYEQAQALYIRALEIYEQQLGIQHPATVAILHHLVVLLFHSTRGWDEGIDQLEPLLEYALAILKETRGLGHSDTADVLTADVLNDLGALYYFHQKYEQAEPLLEQALAIREQILGPEHPDVAQSLNNLAELRRSQKRDREAELLLERALVIREHMQGPEHPDTAQSLHNLALLYDAQDTPVKAEPLYQRALTIRERQLGLKHSDTRSVARNYVSLLRRMGREKDATQLEARFGHQ